MARIGASTVWNIAGKGARFGYTVLLARAVGASGSGLFFLSFGIIQLSSVVGKMGLRRATVKYASSAYGRSHTQGIKKNYSDALKVVFLLSGLLAIGLTLLAKPISIGIFGEPDLEIVLFLMAPSVVFFSIQELQAGVLRSIDRVGTGVFLHNITTNGSFLILLLSGFTQNLSHIVMAYVLSLLLTVSLGTYFTREYIDVSRLLSSSWPSRPLLRTGVLLAPVALSGFAMHWIDTFALGVLKDSSSVGIYEVAYQFSNLVLILQAATNSAMTPKFSELYSSQDSDNRLSEAFNNARLIASIGTVPLVIPLLAVPSILGPIYGEAFVGAAFALQILALSQFLRVVIGPVGNFLAMTGQEAYLQVTVIVTVVLNLVLNVALVPRFGVEGAAAATGIAFVSQNILQLKRVHNIMGDYRSGSSCI